MTTDKINTYDHSDLIVYTRSVGQALGPFEKPVILPAVGNHSPMVHAWADARFVTDIMAEHALFFVLLMPPEVAKKENAEALQFNKIFTELFKKIDKGLPPKENDLKSFIKGIVDEIKPFIDYKKRLGDAQRKGTLRSLVWPLFFDHTQHEAERWVRRLDKLGQGNSKLDRTEVTTFWTNIMDEHARFVAHLLDPDEFELIDKAMKASGVFSHLHGGSIGNIASATIHEPGTVIESLVQNPETDAILRAAETILDFKTEAVRGIEAARIKSIIDPRLADHVRREALKFVDELKRSV